jgi:quinolinate synthase
LATALIQQILPEEYGALTPEEADRRIAAARERLGDSVVILGHHYQRDEIIKFADYTGDSYKLCLHAASHPEADFIVFCGVHFMAESAVILGAAHQRVILPNLSAGCSMADMATRTQVEDLWEELSALTDERIIPVTYMNSSAAIKSFCGEHGGAVCTSSNCEAIFRWALEEGDKIAFFPDEHLGRNTALHMGFRDEDMALWDPTIPPEMNDREGLRRAKIVLWKGFCSVHARFSVEQIQRARRDFPGIRVIVHPECRREVVEAADGFGSTEYISRVIRESEPGSQWAVGTEINLVSRLAKELPDRLIFCLDPIVCPCSTMYRIEPRYLCWALENLVEGHVVNEITVPERDVRYAKAALDRMMEITAAARV